MIKPSPDQIVDQSEVLIRPPVPGDCRAFVRAVRGSRTLHASWIAPKPGSSAEFSRYVKRFDRERHFGYLVIHKPSGGIVGAINIYDVVRGPFQSGTLGYYAMASFAGKGMMSAGMHLVLRRAFGELSLHRLEANIQPANAASIALVRKCGFVCEGLARRLLKVRGRWRDHERWAILAEDFRE